MGSCNVKIAHAGVFRVITLVSLISVRHVFHIRPSPLQKKYSIKRLLLVIQTRRQKPAERQTPVPRLVGGPPLLEVFIFCASRMSSPICLLNISDSCCKASRACKRWVSSADTFAVWSLRFVLCTSSVASGESDSCSGKRVKTDIRHRVSTTSTWREVQQSANNCVVQNRFRSQS